MRILALSTAEQFCSLAIFQDGQLLYEECWNSRLTHSKRVLGMIENALDNRVKFSLDKVDALICAKGPGSFTGLRIGISVIQAMAYASGKTAFGVSSLDGIAYRFAETERPVCAMMDAKRGEVYTAVYVFEKKRLKNKTPEQVLSPDAILDKVDEKTLFAGSGAIAYKDSIHKWVKNGLVCDASKVFVSATALIQAALEKENFFDDPQNFLAPTYIRKSDAEMQFIEKQG